ncbi:hypothetical protein HK096_007702, partial [Nowakowskiella sp. JEL0078]
MRTSSDPRPSCFVCWESSPREALIRPCLCFSEDLKYAHSSCMLLYLNLNHQLVSTHVEANESSHLASFPTWTEWRESRLAYFDHGNALFHASNFKNLIFSLKARLSIPLYFISWSFLLFYHHFCKSVVKPRNQIKSDQTPMVYKRCSICKTPYRISVQKAAADFKSPRKSHLDSFKSFLRMLSSVVSKRLFMITIFIWILIFYQICINIYSETSFQRATLVVHENAEIESRNKFGDFKSSSLAISLTKSYQKSKNLENSDLEPVPAANIQSVSEKINSTLKHTAEIRISVSTIKQNQHSLLQLIILYFASLIFFIGLILYSSLLVCKLLNRATESFNEFIAEGEPEMM